LQQPIFSPDGTLQPGPPDFETPQPGLGIEQIPIDQQDDDLLNNPQGNQPPDGEPGQRPPLPNQPGAVPDNRDNGPQGNSVDPPQPGEENQQTGPQGGQQENQQNQDRNSSLPSGFADQVHIAAGKFDQERSELLKAMNDLGGLM